MLAKFITKIIDFFYRPFSKYFSVEFFRYGCCGVGNQVFDWVLYFLCYNFIFKNHTIELWQFSITPHIAALCVVFPITLLTGFWLNKYVTFTHSSLRGRKQLMRYISIVALNLFINYFGLKLFVDIFQFYPTPSKMLITFITFAVSYFGQKYYSFK